MLFTLQKGGIARNTFFMFFANLAYAFFSWAQLSLVTKFTDNTVLGVYTLAIAIVTPLYLFSNMQLRSLIITDHENKFSFGDYFNYRILGNIFLLIVVTFICLFLGIKNVWVIFLFSCIKIVESNADIINAFFQKKEEMHYISISVILKSFLGFLGFLVGIYVLSDIIYGLLLSLILNLVVYVFYDRVISIKKGNFRLKKLNYTNLKSIFKIAIPLGVVSGIISLNGSISKFFLEGMEGTEIQGVYSSISYMVILGTFVCNAVGQSFAPRMSKYYLNKNVKAFKSLQSKFLIFNVLVGLLGCLLSFVMGKQILLVFYNEEIAGYYKLFNWVMISGFFSYMLTALGYTMTSIREFNIQPKINGAMLVLKLAIIWFFILKYGIYGAVYTQIFVCVIQCIVVGYFIRLNIKTFEKV